MNAGAIDLLEALRALQQHIDWTDGSEWSKVLDCIAHEWEFHGDVVGGCAVHFADSFEWSEAEDLLTCAHDVWDLVCEMHHSNDINMDICNTFCLCGDLMFHIDDCAGYVSDLGTSVSVTQFSISFLLSTMELCISAMPTMQSSHTKDD